MKRFKFLTFLFVIFLALTHFYFPRFITEINNPIVRKVRNIVLYFKPKLVHKKLDFLQDKNQKKINELKRSSFSFVTKDQTRISYNFYPTSNQPKGTILLLHGIHSSKERYNTVSKLLSKNGYQSIAIDLRAHGKSTGKFCTFGIKEKYDIQELLDELNTNKEVHLTENIGIWGHSLGGATALQTLAIEPRIKFGIIESAFSEFTSITNDYSDYYLKFKFKPFSDYITNRAGKLSKFDPKEASPVKACSKIKQPMLIVHGDADKKINIKYGQRNFEALASKEKEFLPIKNGSHDYLWEEAGKDYFEKVIQFIDQQYSQ